uniref:Gamma-interferon-inducible lysosomal thiol reductase n=1 Tax=Chromera velia CCMP2878 TaxID=1169474 RepID=A0A0G4H8G2_9ALVE|mmetsp:Transcript_33383/g.66190  ORF Transcript_33383/g.66190 Transcript_33383/m.66190 type:complete len:257 (+) Transcript_33383:136-906(+)|eukprot:Cvel_25150.t1-p1 / transcript=Cvel_25150.t1 / gene=Cvel_25150 / organism=Chromera_velia_CCMP2878 / gene_product=Gamma-interferon-inducible lysosomal thiol, putative / transcript_product=Gamma-interferon-inducible lysosomal thiol, putative / location=Cvel_scaffold2812:13930-17354(-) / protein_length=256 / sequence_SO=supercontig / SO=protein_coding / is_pseudo=false
MVHRLLAALTLAGLFGLSAAIVDVQLYYEPLCPYCRDFILKQLVPAVNSDAFAYFNVKMVPAGNTQDMGNGSWMCQHGDDECFLNNVESCAMKHIPIPDENDNVAQLKFVACLAGKGELGRSQWTNCPLEGVTKEVEDCVNGPEGPVLAKSMVVETSKLNPPHEYVPWVVINGAPSDKADNDLLGAICDAIKVENPPVDPLPSSCQGGGSKAGKPMDASASLLRAIPLVGVMSETAEASGKKPGRCYRGEPVQVVV